jgi:hypothetical protein
VVNQSSSKELVLSLDEYGPYEHKLPKNVKIVSAAGYSVTLPPRDEWSGSIFYKDPNSFRGCYFQFRVDGSTLKIATAPSIEGVKCSVSGTNLAINVSS